MPKFYLVINLKTQQIIRRGTTAQAARNLRDKLDLHHGSINFVVRPIYA